MTVAFRVDSGHHMGAGHVMRCLTLAKALSSELSLTPHFICRPHAGNLGDYLEDHGQIVRYLASGISDRPLPDADHDPPHASWLGVTIEADAAETLDAIPVDTKLLIIDHYALDARFEKALRGKVRKIMVIDDLVDRPHDCDLLLDQSYGRKDREYKSLVPGHCRLLMGTGFALLRPEFVAARPEALVARGKTDRIRHLMLTMGAMDSGNITTRVVEALRDAKLDKLTVVLGRAAPHLTDVFAAMKTLPYAHNLVVDSTSMAELMTAADAVIGTVGATSWERCCLGLPTLGIVAADNQKQAAQALVRAGAMAGPLTPDEVTPYTLKSFIQTSRDDYQAMSKAAANICDGDGTSRVVAAIRELLS